MLSSCASLVSLAVASKGIAEGARRLLTGAGIVVCSYDITSRTMTTVRSGLFLIETLPTFVDRASFLNTTKWIDDVRTERGNDVCSIVAPLATKFFFS